MQKCMKHQAEELRARGIVQGVGFRPTAYRLAKECNLRGEIWNDGEGVAMRIAGRQTDRDRFVALLLQECPPLARIEAITRVPLDADVLRRNFAIIPSVSTKIQTQVAPDAASCPACVAETFDANSRFYRYPFTNCTHCGPRLSIIRALPYDRRQTSMANFTPCPQCAREYQDVSDRRFHAQPIACPDCGPRVWLERADGDEIPQNLAALDAIAAARELIKQGEIVAIKGLGGVHLACDATNPTAVCQLRQRKKRDRKPFALMARNIEIITRYCQVSAAERELLRSPAAPIVLLQKRQVTAEISELPEAIAPGVMTLGFMLPYTPLHHLLLEDLDYPIILTSGNRSGEPQCTSNRDAWEQLGAIASYFLLHDREIINRVDDSVARVTNGQTQILRRARGYAPAPIALPAGFESSLQVLALGSELKNTFCLLRDGRAILSQHLGDLENPTAYTAYCQALQLYQELFEFQPEAIAIDRHTEYLSAKLGREWAEREAIALHSIQHHHAHTAACLVGNQIPLQAPPVLGVAFDGLGFGDDGTLWGGEFLLATYQDFQRVASFEPIAILGGAQAIREPWRNTYAHLHKDFDAFKREFDRVEILHYLESKPRKILDRALARNYNSPLASSVGRLFDAVAAAVGICRDRISYEGQAAIELEALVRPQDLQIMQPYLFDIRELPDRLQIESRSMWRMLLADLQSGVSPIVISARFHLGLAEGISQVVARLRSHHEFSQVTLTGGVFQNQTLAKLTRQKLTALGLQVLEHRLIPPNDGGLSLGQAAITAAQSFTSKA